MQDFCSRYFYYSQKALIETIFYDREFNLTDFFFELENTCLIDLKNLVYKSSNEKNLISDLEAVSIRVGLEMLSQS